MRCILNRVLLALSWISIRAAADAQMLLKKQGFSPKLVLAVRDSEIPGGGFPEMLLQKGERFRSQIRARLNAQPLHPCRGACASSLDQEQAGRGDLVDLPLPPERDAGSVRRTVAIPFGIVAPGVDAARRDDIYPDVVRREFRGEPARQTDQRHLGC